MKKHIFTGLIILLPLWITFFILWMFIKGISNLAKPFVTAISLYLIGIENPTFIGFISFVLSIMIIYLIGLIADNIIGKRFITKLELTITTFPIIKDIYISAKKLINFLAEYKMYNWSKVVLIEYPRKGIYTFGIVTSEFENRDKIGVFVATTPNPTTGMLIYVDKNEVKYTSLKIEEAVQIIVSGGVISSKELEKYL